MIKMADFRLDLDGTEEERKQIVATKGLSGVTVTIEMPVGSVIRRVNTRLLQTEKMGVHPETKQLGRFIIPEECVYIWAEVQDPPIYGMKPHYFKIIPTGCEVPTHLAYVGTFLLQAGHFAFHVYGPIVD